MLKHHRHRRIRAAAIWLIVFASGPAAFAAARPDAPTIHLLTAVQAGDAFVEEELEPYFSLMTPLEMAMKTGAALEAETREAQIAECKERYAAAVRDFSDDEAALLREVIEQLHPTLEKHYPLLARTPWSFIKKADSLEAGAHFTRERHIVLSEGFLKRAVAMNNRVAPRQVLRRVGGLLLHEQTHVLQRLHPEKFAKLYTEVWGFTRTQKIESIDWLKQRQVVNPDAVDLGWVYGLKEDDDTTRWIWPRVILTKLDQPRMFRDMAFIAVELEKTDGGFRVKENDDDSATHVPLNDVRAYTQKFPHGGAYHPNEAAAGMLPAVILADVDDAFAPKGEDAQQYLAKHRRWLRENLAGKTQ